MRYKKDAKHNTQFSIAKDVKKKVLEKRNKREEKRIAKKK